MSKQINYLLEVKKKKSELEIEAYYEKVGESKHAESASP